MFSFLKITTLDDKWLLCEDLRWYIWRLSYTRQCRCCGTGLSLDGKISICFVRDECLCFKCWHKSRYPK